MAFRGFVFCLAAITVMIMWSENAAQSDCNSEIISLSPCLEYIKVTGNSSTPSTTCCSHFSTLVKSAPKCLCLVFKTGGFILGTPINQTLALNLPAACKEQIPPISLCQHIPPQF
uniref:Non-specific lipid-transfer protein-like protein At2g13820 family n=1 Tax=Cajanus cajan TaxID=3821 RepID=A0A151U4B6_CAJCA|nr:Non-specific lipid-transfer protein-like protein At2g13820 family [Cajanus cajan]